MIEHPTPIARDSASQRAARLLPFLRWQRPTPATIRDDFIAGITVSLVAVPQSLAYAQLAGVPAHYGLYAAFVPCIVGVLFGSSALLSTGPVAMTSLLTAASVAAVHPPDRETFYALVTLLALLSGVVQLAFGLARAGMLLSLVSHPVLTGFTNAAALIIALSQLPGLIGVPTRQSDHLLIDTWHVVARLDLVHEMSLAFGVASIALLVAFKRFAPRAPGMLVTVAALTAVSYATGFAQRGGRVVGDIPAGLPALAVPAIDWNGAFALAPAAFVVAVVSFMEAASSCKVIALRTRAAWSENQELIGQGLAKIAASFCQSMPVSGSFSRSALNLASHGRTGVSSLWSATAVLVTLLLFTPYLYHLPKPVLAAMIIVAVVGLIDVAAFRRAWVASADDGVAAGATFAATLAFAPNIQIGILIGIVISLCAFIYRRMRPRIAVVAPHADGMLRDVHRYGIASPHPQIGALRLDDALHFGNASYFEDAVLQFERDNPLVRYILIAAQGINHLDATGVEKLRSLSERLRQNGITLAVGGLKRQVLDVIERTGLAATMGADNIFMSERDAIEALLARVEAVER